MVPKTNNLDAIFKYERKLPQRLIKQYAYKNAFFDPNPQWTARYNNDQKSDNTSQVVVEEVPLKVKPESNKAIQELVKRKKNYVMKKNDFFSQRKRLEKCTQKDLKEMFPMSNGEAYLQAKEMIKATDQEILKMYQQSQLQYGRRRTQLLAQGSQQNLLLEPKKKHEPEQHSGSKHSKQDVHHHASSKDVGNQMSPLKFDKKAVASMKSSKKLVVMPVIQEQTEKESPRKPEPPKVKVEEPPSSLSPRKQVQNLSTESLEGSSVEKEPKKTPSTLKKPRSNAKREYGSFFQVSSKEEEIDALR